MGIISVLVGLSNVIWVRLFRTISKWHGPLSVMPGLNLVEYNSPCVTLKYLYMVYYSNVCINVNIISYAIFA